MLWLPLLLVTGLGSSASPFPSTQSPGALAAVRTGDIVLHTSHSKQAVAIAWATKSVYTHTGIVVVENGKPYVYEAVSKVRKTPLDRWIARGDALKVLRHPDVAASPTKQARIARAARTHVGKPYDLSFSPGADRLYCSEYVHAVFARAGVDVGKVQHVRDLDVDNPIVKQLVDARWRAHPVCRANKSRTLADCWPRLLSMEIVTPASIADDDRLVDVTP
jgi:hypothetical protein